MYLEKNARVISVQLNEFSQSEHIHVTKTYDQGQEIEHTVTRGLSGVIKMIHILIMVVNTQLYIFVKNL